MRRCPDCHVRLLRGQNIALCENCNKFFDTSKRRGATFGWHPFWGLAFLLLVSLFFFLAFG